MLIKKKKKKKEEWQTKVEIHNVVVRNCSCLIFTLSRILNFWMLAYFNFPSILFPPSDDICFGSQRSPYVQFLLLLHLLPLLFCVVYLWLVTFRSLLYLFLGKLVNYHPFEAGVNMKTVFWLGIMVLTQISRSRFKQSKISLLISHSYVLGCFVNFWWFLGIFGDK